MVNVLFVKFEHKYSPYEVNSLYNKLSKFGPHHTYYCYTDDPVGLDKNIIPIPAVKPTLRKWWNKLQMFNKDFPVKGKNLYFDIDVNIVDNPFTIVDSVDWDTISIVDCHWKTRYIEERFDNEHNFDCDINSSVILWDSNSTKVHNIWDSFANSPFKDYYLRKYKGIDRYIYHEGFEYNRIDSSFIRSYVNEPDKKAPIVTFEDMEYEGEGTTQ